MEDDNRRRQRQQRRQQRKEYYSRTVTLVQFGWIAASDIEIEKTGGKAVGRVASVVVVVVVNHHESSCRGMQMSTFRTLSSVPSFLPAVAEAATKEQVNRHRPCLRRLPYDAAKSSNDIETSEHLFSSEAELHRSHGPIHPAHRASCRFAQPSTLRPVWRGLFLF